MNLRLFAVITALVLGSAAPAWSQIYTETTTRIEPVIVAGEVVWLDPGKSIVVRSRGEDVSYILGPNVALPPEVQIGSSVTLQLQPGADGAMVLRQITTTTRTRPSSETTTTTTTTSRPISGEIVRLEPGRNIVIRSNGRETRYILSPNVILPAEVQIGSNATLQFEHGPDGTSLVKRVTTTTVNDEGQVKRTTEVTRTRPSGETMTTTSTTAGAMTGEVVRLEPGKTIVLRSDGRETRYTLAPNVTLPAEIQVGRTATVQYEPGPDGTTLVKRVTTTTLSPDGQMKETTEITRTHPTGDSTRMTMSTLTGKVEAYLPGRSVTVLDQNGTRVTYMLGSESQFPSEVLMGKEVTIYTVPKEHGTRVVYEIQRDGNTIKIKAKTKN